IQAARTALPLSPVWLPFPCSNAVYEQRMRELLAVAYHQGVTHMAFGDLFLTEVRDYRVQLLAGTGIEPLFPLWGTPKNTAALIQRMLDAGLRAVVTCVDPAQCDQHLVGRQLDTAFLAELPGTVDPCGERGEFHTFCTAGPMFAEPIGVRAGAHVFRDGFWFADLLAASSEA